MTGEKDAMNAQLKAVRIELLAIAELSKRVPIFLSPNPIAEIRDLLERYSAVRSDFEGIMASRNVDLHLRDIEASVKGRSFPTYIQQKNIGNRVEIECMKGVAALDALTTSVPKTELNRLKSLREELRTLSTQLRETNYEKNVSQAIDEYEAGHTLASALISSRAICRILDEVPGKSDEEKVTFLEGQGALDKERRDIHESLVKSSRLARNFLSHRIDVFPSSAEALSLLADTVRLLPIAVKFLPKG